MGVSAPLQASQPEFDFEIESQSGPLLVLRFQAREALSSLYEVRLEIAAAADVDVDVAALIGKPACLTVHSEAESRFFHGVVARMAQGRDCRRKGHRGSSGLGCRWLARCQRWGE